MNHETDPTHLRAPAWRGDAAAVSQVFQRLRSIQEEALRSQTEAANLAASKALEAAGRAVCARDAAEAVAAQAALALAFAEFAAAPVLACLDAVPRMQAACMDALAAGAPPASAAAPPAGAPLAAPPPRGPRAREAAV